MHFKISIFILYVALRGPTVFSSPYKGRQGGVLKGFLNNQWELISQRRDVEKKDILCGPVPFPEFSCENINPAPALPPCNPDTGFGPLGEKNCQETTPTQRTSLATPAPGFAGKTLRPHMYKTKPMAPTAVKQNPNIGRINMPSRTPVKSKGPVTMRTKRLNVYSNMKRGPSLRKKRKKKKAKRNKEDATSSTRTFRLGEKHRGEDYHEALEMCDNVAKCEIHNWRR